MSTSRLRWIIGLMGISVIALIAFQWQWITTAVKTNEDQFRQSVMESMISVANKLERREVMQMVNKQVLQQAGYTQNNAYASQQTGLNFYYEQWDTTSTQVGFDITLEIDPTGQIKYQVHDLSKPPEANGPKPEEVRLLEDTLTDLRREQQKLANLKEGQDTMIRETLERMNNKSKLLVSMLEELMYSQPFYLRLPTEVLDSMLSSELQERGVSIPYEFGVWETNPITWLAGETTNRQRDIVQSEFSVSLFPNDFYGSTQRLSLIFPTKDRFLASKLYFNMASSTILLLIILFSFGYSIYTIFRQKKLSIIKTDFINNMTHEFKTPIATIGLAVEAMQDKALAEIPNMRERYIGVIGEENKRLGNQVEKVLQMAVIERKELKLNMELTDLHEVIKKAVDKISLQLENRGGKIQMALDAETSTLKLDPNQMMHVLLNLLDNAIKYSEDAPNILIRTQLIKNKIMVSVRDHGIGMSREAQRNIFQSFYRVTTGNLHDVKGFGLGLAFVKSIIEEHKGTIEVDSELGAGTKFTFTIPIDL